MITHVRNVIIMFVYSCTCVIVIFVYTGMLLTCVLQCVAVCCSVLQCVAVCCSVLQCVAIVCCSVLQCVIIVLVYTGMLLCIPV